MTDDPTKPQSPAELERLKKIQDRYTPRDTPSILTQRREQMEIARLKAEVKNLTQELMNSEYRKEIIQELARPVPAIPKREFKSKYNDGTAVVMASDWHVEATVDPDKVNGWNAFNPEIAVQRVDRLIYGIRSLIDLHRGKTKVRDLVLGMIGDMINGYIHLEYRQTNSMAPPSACRFFKQLAIHLFDSLLQDTELERIVVPCMVGNHGRIDVKKPAAVAIENSFELMVYADLADHYKNETRISIGVPTGLVMYNRVYDFTLRWEHGDAFGYQGGIGGVFIPFNKHVARRDSKIQATVTHVGHWHQLKMLPHACMNGCFTAETRVLTPSGPRPIAGVERGMTLLAKDGTFQTVEATRSRTTRDLIRLRAKGLPNFIRCTPNHLVWAIKGESTNDKRKHPKSCQGRPTVENERPQWIPAEFLSEGDWVVTPTLKGTETADKELLWAFGLFMAEGHTILDGGASGMHNRIEFSMHIEEAPYLARAKAVLDKALGKEGRFWDRPNRTTSHLSYSGRDVAQKFRQEFGHRSHGKQVPAWMFGLTAECRAEVVRGWVDGDGHYGKCVSASTVSERLAWGMWMLAAGTEWEPMLYRGISRARESSRGEMASWRVSFVGDQDVRWVDGERFVPIDFRSRETLAQEEAVYDLQMSGEHTYCVEGVGVHNSMIGYDEYADSKGFEFEYAAQGFYMLDSKQGPHGWAPIWVQRVDDKFETEARVELGQHIRGTGEWAKRFRVGKEVGE